MPEPETTALIDQLRCSNRRWKAVALVLSLVLTLILVAAGGLAVLQGIRLAAERDHALAAEHQARELLEQARQAEEKARKEAEEAAQAARRAEEKARKP